MKKVGFFPSHDIVHPAADMVVNHVPKYELEIFLFRLFFMKF